MLQSMEWHRGSEGLSSTELMTGRDSNTVYTRGIVSVLGTLLFSHSVIALCDPMDCSMPGFSVLPYFLEFAQTHVH